MLILCPNNNGANFVLNEIEASDVAFIHMLADLPFNGNNPPFTADSSEVSWWLEALQPFVVKGGLALSKWITFLESCKGYHRVRRR